jgi:hypothetical protein
MASLEKDTLDNENGFVVVVVLIMLAIITIMGIAATRTSETEIRIAVNERLYKEAFYTAEAGAVYVAESPQLYGSDNVTVGGFLNFPYNDDPSEEYSVSSRQSFNGDVEYLGFSAPPRGSGYDAQKFRAHRYSITCNGFGGSGSQSRIEVGFYRIGF